MIVSLVSQSGSVGISVLAMPIVVKFSRDGWGTRLFLANLNLAGSQNTGTQAAL